LLRYVAVYGILRCSVTFVAAFCVAVADFAVICCYAFILTLLFCVCFPYGLFVVVLVDYRFFFFFFFFFWLGGLGYPPAVPLTVLPCPRSGFYCSGCWVLPFGCYQRLRLRCAWFWFVLIQYRIAVRFFWVAPAGPARLRGLWVRV